MKLTSITGHLSIYSFALASALLFSACTRTEEKKTPPIQDEKTLSCIKAHGEKYYPGWKTTYYNFSWQNRLLAVVSHKGLSLGFDLNNKTVTMETWNRADLKSFERESWGTQSYDKLLEREKNAMDAFTCCFSPEP